MQALTEMLTLSGGDLRKAITTLQSANALYGGRVTVEAVVEISGVLPSKDVATLMDRIKKGTFDDGRRTASNIIAAGYSLATVLDKVRACWALAARASSC
ncbi:hypothetical protein EON66_06790 [archaeon]|nr:MAG: hypothetical protein EON66_06790 [archaeon]